MSFGDCFSLVGMLNYLTKYYDEIYLYISKIDIYIYFDRFFKNFPENKISVIYDFQRKLDFGNYGDYDICDMNSGGWEGASTVYIDFPNINPEFYFNDQNPIYSKLDIPKEDRFEPNIHLPLTSLEVNHKVYYKLIGLNPNIRLDYFDYIRNINREEDIKKTLLKKYNITDKYVIINNPFEEKKFVETQYPQINIHEKSECLGDLLSLIEGAESLYLIEGFNVSFLYNCQYKGILRFNKPVYFHDWMRPRRWEQLNLDYSWKMFDEPKLDNWTFIFERP
jgi:hypothetical protein